MTLPKPLGDSQFHSAGPEVIALGRLLFFDKILSGNRNISCATCHSPDFGGSDGVSLGIGEGGSGIGPERRAGDGDDAIRKRIPRNAPALWNLGAMEVKTLQHDGRIETSGIYGNGFDTPAEEWLPKGLGSPLAAQALFPMASQFEMAGNPKENEIAGALHDRIDNVWPIVAKRVRAIPEYGERFREAFGDVSRPEDVTIVHIANALAGFISAEWRSLDSPFDRLLAGDASALGPRQASGMRLFYGKGRCASCHSGPLLTDHRFHALALPHFGPGRARRFDPHARDVGRMGASDRLEDAYRFRTPSLRNVALTAPYGHNGAYPTLQGIIRHHLDPVAMLEAWRPGMAILPPAPGVERADFAPLDDRLERARLRAKLDIKPVNLEEWEIMDIISFLHALTGESARAAPPERPAAVPSGLPVD